MKFLGIDYGLKRIGLAKGDDINYMAFPLGCIINKNIDFVMSEILKISEKEKFDIIVIGLPLDTHLEETEQSVLTRKFGNTLKEKLDLPVFFENEIFSTQEATNKWPSQKFKKIGLIDQTAALIILQSHFDKIRFKK